MPGVSFENRALGVNFENVEKRFGSFVALRRVALQIAPGEFAVLVGHNGSGKTTLLRMGASLILPTHGRVNYTGEKCDDLQSVKQRIGMVGHNSLVYDELTASENLAFFAKLYGLAQPSQIAGEWLASSGLGDRSRDLVRTFSRGMRQRLAICRALIASPSLLLLDEPATGLDREGVAWLARMLAEVRERRCTVIMTSHGHSEAIEFATRAIAMRAGAVIADSGADGDVRGILDREIVAAGPQSVPAATR